MVLIVCVMGLALANLVGYAVVRLVFHLASPKTKAASNYVFITGCYAATSALVFAAVHWLTQPALMNTPEAIGTAQYYFLIWAMLMISLASHPFLMVVLSLIFLLLTFGIGLSIVLKQEWKREQKRKLS